MTNLPVDYILEFQQKLGDAVSQALDLGNPVIGGLKASSLYSDQLQISAAVAGSELGIPSELAICYLVSAEAMRYEQGINKLDLLMSKEKREKYSTHRALMQFAMSLIREVPDKSLSGMFLSLMMKDLARSNQK